MSEIRLDTDKLKAACDAAGFSLKLAPDKYELVPNRRAPAIEQKKPYGFEDFFAEAEAKGLTVDQLMADWKRMRPQDFEPQAQAEPVAITLSDAFDAGWNFYAQAFAPGVIDARDVARLLTSDYWPALLKDLSAGDHTVSKGAAIVAIKREIYSRLNKAQYPIPAAPAVPAGWKLVPIEPTEKMVKAIQNETDAPHRNWARDAYRAMLMISPEQGGDIEKQRGGV